MIQYYQLLYIINIKKEKRKKIKNVKYAISLSILAGNAIPKPPISTTLGSKKIVFQMIVDEYNNEIDDYLNSINNGKIDK